MSETLIAAVRQIGMVSSLCRSILLSIDKSSP